MAVFRRVALALAATALVAVAGCGSGSKRVLAGLPLWQRVLQGGELSGYDPQIQPPASLNLPRFIAQARPAFVRITDSGARKELTADGFRTATIENFPSGRGNVLTLASTVIWVSSNAQAQHTVDWGGKDSLQPCPKTCNAKWEELKVPGIPGARGAHRFNLPDAKPFESFNILYADGPFVYDLFVFARKQGVVKEKDLIHAVNAQYKRIKGAPLPHFLVMRGRGVPAPQLP